MSRVNVLIPRRAYLCFIFFYFTALSVTVSADAALLMAEMLRVFVQGKDCVWCGCIQAA